jgi:adenosylcobinamide-phosphate synthase
MSETGILTLAYLLDLVIGDPRRLPHPVRVIGWAIIKVEGLLRKIFKGFLGRRLAGVVLVVIIVGSTYGLFYGINSALLNLRFLIASYIILIYLTSTTFATHELIKSAESVVNALHIGDIKEARKKLSLIVSRDTETLDRDGILKATVETLAENASDGIIAPLFYFAIGGLPLAMTYKAINTLDSMVGYKNERYKDIGWAAARLDDIANFIPARITGILIVLASFLSSIFHFPSSIPHRHVNWQNAYRTMFRDGRRHLSPNSGIPEAAMAGALGIRLGGPSTYGGVLVKKPYIGEDRPSTDDLYLKAPERTITITKITSFLGFISAIGLLYLRTGI